MKAEYRLLKFSPVPEFLDPVNIALILTAEDKHRVLWDEGFRRLRCQAPNFNHDLLAFLLNDISAEIRDLPAEKVRAFIHGRSSQLRVTEPRPLLTQPNARIERALKENYLLPLRREHSEQRETDEKYISTKLQEFLLQRVGVRTQYLQKRVRVEDCLSSRSRQLLGDEPLKVNRVINGHKGIILVDGISLEGTPSYVGSRAETIAYAFYRIGRIRDELAKIEQKTVTRASVVFNYGLKQQNSHLEYYVEKLKRDADTLVDTENSDSVATFSESCKIAEGDLL